MANGCWFRRQIGGLWAILTLRQHICIPFLCLILEHCATWKIASWKRFNRWHVWICKVTFVYLTLDSTETALDVAWFPAYTDHFTFNIHSNICVCVHLQKYIRKIHIHIWNVSSCTEIVNHLSHGPKDDEPLQWSFEEKRLTKRSGSTAAVHHEMPNVGKTIS